LGRETSWSRLLILSLSGGVLVFAPLAFGAVHTWAYVAIGLVVGLMSLALLAYGLYLVWAEPLESRAWPYPAWWWLGGGLALVTCLQIIPWPQGAVRWLSPGALEIRSLGNGFGLAAYLPLSLNPDASLLEGLKFWPGIILFFLLIYTVKTRKQMRVLAGTILGVAFFEILYGFWQLRSHMIWGWQNPYTQTRLCGTFINSNHLAILLTMAILLGFGLLLTQKEKRSPLSNENSGWVSWQEKSSAEHLEPLFRRFTLLFFLLLLTVGLIFTGSRGGMASLVVGFTIMGLLFWGQRWQKAHVILVAIFLAVAVLYSLFLGSAQVLSRFQEAGAEIRYSAFKGALAIFGQFPLTGSGLATFGDLFYRYEPASLKGAYFLQTHSDWLQLLAETGLLGFSLVTVAWLSFFSRMAQQWRRRQDSFPRGLGLGCLAALGAGAFHGLAEFPFHIPAITLCYAAIAALTYLTLYSHQRGDLEYFSYPTGARHSGPWRRTAALVSVIIVQLAFLLAISYHGLAERIAPSEIDSTRTPLKLQGDDFRQALALDPRNSKYYLGLARALEREDGEQAVFQIEQALQAAIFFAPAHWGYRLKLAEFCLRRPFPNAPNIYIPMGLKELDAAVKLFPESALLHGYLASSLAWADKYYPEEVPSNLRGQSARHAARALALDSRVRKYLSEP
jgi:O-antigen ligase